MNKFQPTCIIDIGACVGVFIDHCLEQYPTAQIYAFEPLPVNYRHLQQKYQGVSRVTLFPQAISNFEGTAPLYKKGYLHKQWGLIPHKRYNFAGNEGSSLNPEKSNVSTWRSELVSVISFSTVLHLVKEDRIDILKIDSEGTEYDILFDILNNEFYKRINRIYFEDHTRKIPSLRVQRDKFLIEAHRFNIIDKFYLQRDHLTYVPFAAA